MILNLVHSDLAAAVMVILWSALGNQPSLGCLV